MNWAQSLYRVLLLKKILQLCMKLNSHMISQFFFFSFNMRRSGVKEQAWVPGWTLSIKKTLQHPQSFCLGVQENVPHLEMFPKCLQSRVLEIQFIALRQKLDQVLISEIKHPCLSPRGKKKKRKTENKNKTQVILNWSQCIPPKYWKQRNQKDRICVLSEIPLNLADKN